MKKIIVISLFIQLCWLPLVSSAAMPFLTMFIAKKHPQCPPATPTTSSQFCGSFKEAATCYCHASHVPTAFCQNIDSLYKRMIFVFGSETAACRYQQDASIQTCLDAWQCFMRGNKSADGHLCSSNGKACARL